jgi:hypothetical protein
MTRRRKSTVDDDAWAMITAHRVNGNSHGLLA